MLITKPYIKYYIKNISLNKYVDVYWDDEYVLVNERDKVSNCIYLSEQEAIEELWDMTEQGEMWEYIIEKIFII